MSMQEPSPGVGEGVLPGSSQKVMLGASVFPSAQYCSDWIIPCRSMQLGDAAV